MLDNGSSVDRTVTAAVAVEVSTEADALADARQSAEAGDGGANCSTEGSTDHNAEVGAECRIEGGADHTTGDGGADANANAEGGLAIPVLVKALCSMLS